VSVTVVVIRRITENDVESFIAIGTAISHNIAWFPAVLGWVGQRVEGASAVNTGHSEFGIHSHRVRSPA
jgi:hypothetical protein